MKRLSLAIVFSCCTLALAAQDVIQVSFQGAKPTISDFAWAFLFSEDDEDECDHEATAGIGLALSRQREGIPQEEGVTLTIDEKNGYILYECKREDGNSLHRTEMCYWNESDNKHKLFAYSNWFFEDGKPSLGQYDGLTFFRYDNATREMHLCPPPGFEVQYFNTSYTLPRTGKDIIVTTWSDNGKKKQQTLKWNGHRFNL